MPVRVGTSGWSYPGGRGTWNGVFYPPKGARPRGFDELEFYARWFDTVEVNSTFYGQPRAVVTARWAERTPSTFDFAIKLFQKFTHPEMFRQAVRTGAPGAPSDAVMDVSTVRQADVDEFKAGIEPLAAAGKLGALLAQFPPSFTATAEAVDYLGWLLRTFSTYPVAVELRHKTWSDAEPETAALLEAYGAAWVLIDEPKFPFSIQQRWMAVPTSAAPVDTERHGTAYIRLHGRNAAEWWRHAAAEDRYNYLYTEDELRPFVEAATGAAARVKKAYLFFNNHFAAQGVANAVQVRQHLGDAPREPLPPALIATYPWLVSGTTSP